MKRFAAVKNASSRKQLEAYLPEGYKVVTELLDHSFLIAGEDNAGWTMDDYVIPRLASGLIWAEEITEDTFRDNWGLVFYEGTLIQVFVFNSTGVMFSTFEGIEPKVNRIPVEFRVHIKVTPRQPVDHEIYWQIDNAFIYRAGAGFRDEATSSIRGKVRLFTRGYLEDGNVPAKTFNIGQQMGIEVEIRQAEHEILNLKEQVHALEEKKRDLQVQLEGTLR